jgi:deoxyadenosine/deoxycytidine kinase
MRAEKAASMQEIDVFIALRGPIGNGKPTIKRSVKQLFQIYERRKSEELQRVAQC